MDQENDTIFAVQLTKETEITPIIPDLPDDVQGLAVDPIEDVLYWTDSVNRTISSVKLNLTSFEPRLLFAFGDQSPQDIAVDVCRRYVYWTNSDLDRPTIERAKLDGTARQVLVDSDLRMPAGIAIDYTQRRIYWADMREGIYYRIDSANLDGTDREIVYEGTHTKPFGVAVDEVAVYWTDVNDNALWRFAKRRRGAAPEKIREYLEKPMGLVAKNLQVRNYPDCKELELAIERQGGEAEAEVFEVETGTEEAPRCLNGGDLVDGKTCQCRRGYTGRYCETENCHNFCIRGTCRLSPTGYPQCRCPSGYGGARCQADACSAYCLNDGACVHTRGGPECRCRSGFAGTRCEISAELSELCRAYCDDVSTSDDFGSVCGCNATSARIVAPPPERTFWTKVVEDPAYSTLLMLVAFCVVIIGAMAAYIAVNRRRRPTIKKRIIVNKNVTPLTYRPRPAATEHCEITIENCCNMNVCETPCFEPRRGRDDKKQLLAHMEGGEEAY
ncbi:protein cueball isoform X2 [Cylas formicarius]|nr:protein cueball isoform X2 [Cylas formicarius]